MQVSATLYNLHTGLELLVEVRDTHSSSDLIEILKQWQSINGICLYIQRGHFQFSGNVISCLKRIHYLWHIITVYKTSTIVSEKVKNSY